ncbi:MAG: type-F conjugative transfer system secretin TraK [Hafnia sp.]
MKRKSNHGRRPRALLSLAVVIASSLTGAAAQAAAPVKVLVSPDAQVQIALSNTDPNMVVVPGDRIVAIDSAQGVFINANDYGQTGQANGGVVLMTKQDKPFTFYVRTEGGLTVSIIGVPQKREGRIVQLLSDSPVRHREAQTWERSHPYVTTLVELQRTLLNGKVPQGYVDSPVVRGPAFASLPAAVSVRAEQMWSGGGLRVYRLNVRNTGSSSVSLSERLFSAEGVRSVMIAPYGDNLMPATQTTVYVTVDNPTLGGQNDGQY